jgi:hypothetical protein
MIINPYVFGAAYDPDAQAFITAAGLTDNTQKSAINTLVVSLKGFGIWTKMKAIYPFVGGTATTHKFNLKNPLDTNAAFRLVFNGGWTHSATGALPNGTNAFANTFMGTNNMGLNSIHYSYYSRTNTLLNCQEMGVLQNTPNSYSDLGVRNLGGGAFIRLNNGAGVTFATNLDSRGFYTGNRTASNVIKLFKNGSNIQSLTDFSSATSTFATYIGALNNAGTAGAYSNRECAFASIGDGLLDSEAANLYLCVQQFNTTLNRQV